MNAHNNETASNHPACVLTQITPVQRLDSSTADEITRRLEHVIVACGLRAGDCLGTKEDLRRRLRVSPGTMNEAVRILESRGVIKTRRGLKGGLFVSSIPVQFSLKRVVRALEHNVGLIEHYWAVWIQLEPLVVAEATESASVDSLIELNSLASRMDVAIDNPIELLSRCWSLYRKIAEMGSNPLLTVIYTALLDILEQESGLLQYPIPNQLVARGRNAVEAIVSGDPQRAARVATQDRFKVSLRH